jgi:hypothetical protein
LRHDPTCVTCPAVASCTSPADISPADISPTDI